MKENNEKHDFDLLWEFFWWLDAKGFLDDDLQVDPKHQIETYLKNKDKWKREFY